MSQSELDTVLARYWSNSPWLLMTNTAGLGGTNVHFPLPNSSGWDFSLEFSTVRCGSIAAAREKGLYRMEGKEYVVQDGDMLMFKFNV